MNLPRILVIDDVDARLAQTVRVDASLLAQGIEARGDDQSGRLAREVGRAHGEAHGSVRSASPLRYCSAYHRILSRGITWASASSR